MTDNTEREQAVKELKEDVARFERWAVAAKAHAERAERDFTDCALKLQATLAERDAALLMAGEALFILDMIDNHGLPLHDNVYALVHAFVSDDKSQAALVEWREQQ